jgi:mRNA-degrading endonuclease RelE of RelBE toxin-antitoxin system
MKWQVLFHPEFQPEFKKLPEDIQDEFLARLKVLEQFGPNLGRPHGRVPSDGVGRR